MKNIRCQGWPSRNRLELHPKSLEEKKTMKWLYVPPEGGMASMLGWLLLPADTNMTSTCNGILIRESYYQILIHRRICTGNIPLSTMEPECPGLMDQNQHYKMDSGTNCQPMKLLEDLS